MPKLPDFSKLTEKLDLQGIMNSVKSIINPETGIPKNLEGDPIAAKLALIRIASETLINLQQQQQQEITKINMLIASLYKDLEASKQPTTANSEETSRDKMSEKDKKE